MAESSTRDLNFALQCKIACTLFCSQVAPFSVILIYHTVNYAFVMLNSEEFCSIRIMHFIVIITFHSGVPYLLFPSEWSSCSNKTYFKWTTGSAYIITCVACIHDPYSCSTAAPPSQFGREVGTNSYSHLPNNYPSAGCYDEMDANYETFFMELLTWVDYM